MNHISQKLCSLLAICLLVCPLFLHRGLASPVVTPTLHLTGTVKYTDNEGGFYGILGDDGIKYQPTNLPRKFRKDGLSLKFDAVRKDGMVGTFQWGSIVELSNVNQLSGAIPAEERGALYVLLKRINAFNHKDITLLQEIDLEAKSLTEQQLDAWIGQYNNYTLRYIDIDSTTSSTVKGSCYYTRELTNGMTLHGNMDLAAMTFTMIQTPTGWKLSESGHVSNSLFHEPTDAFAELTQKALAKYNTDNLATLVQ